ncbi:MAG: 4Fe-4S binding protein [bacterium]
MAYKITDECVLCGVCMDVCPAGAIKEGEEKYSIDPEACTDCGSCAEVCPSDAIVGPEE